jgi:hypothetical protein
VSQANVLPNRRDNVPRDEKKASGTNETCRAGFEEKGHFAVVLWVS